MDAEFLQQVLQELVADQTGATLAGPQVIPEVTNAHAAGKHLVAAAQAGLG